MTVPDFPGHGEVITDTLNTRVHDNEAVYRCTRCNVVVPQDDPDALTDTDCDRYAQLGQKITGSVNEALSDDTDGGSN